MRRGPLSTPFSGFLLVPILAPKFGEPAFNSLFGIPDRREILAFLLTHLSTPFSGFPAPASHSRSLRELSTPFSGFQIVYWTAQPDIINFQLPFRDSQFIEKVVCLTSAIFQLPFRDSDIFTNLRDTLIVTFNSLFGILRNRCTLAATRDTLSTPFSGFAGRGASMGHLIAPLSTPFSGFRCGSEP